MPFDCILTVVVTAVGTIQIRVAFDQIVFIRDIPSGCMTLKSDLVYSCGFVRSKIPMKLHFSKVQLHWMLAAQKCAAKAATVIVTRRNLC